MNLYHQTGHNYKWNVQSYLDDNTGNGLILSPMNISYSDLLKIPTNVKKNCLFDSQYYIPNDVKGKLSSYDFFPANMVDDFKTIDFLN